ncbi:hypothetical protein IWQ47_002026 [Aquimarina sp. EL_43]|nr:hypothetical protein [Aquimarina sp. EL_35]MBG6151304.1 hypothetical protein [Aquimarina sp. EL_32]MBG6168952.1 hypothetical protein [Aquimarina sp. EL_43]
MNIEEYREYCINKKGVDDSYDLVIKNLFGKEIN